MVVPHEPGMLALAFVLLGHEAKPKVNRLCRDRLSAAIKRLRRAERAGPFAATNPRAVAGAQDTIRTLCRTCGSCRGV